MSDIKALHEQFSVEISAINALLQSNLPIDIHLLNNVFKHIFNAGGKRLRPLLTLMISHLISNESNDSTIALAAAVELIHTATLLHDDVIDNALIRRGLKTANNIWGDKTSILIGDFMLSKAFQLIIAAGKNKAFKELADAAATISAAEIMQLQLLSKLDITLDEYFKLITDKTAVLFGAACAIGAIANDCDNEIIESARNFGINYGIAYQIKDDLLDYTGDSVKLGKDNFQDIKEGKITLPIILLLQKAEQSILAEVLLAIKEYNTHKILQFIKEYNIVELVHEQINHYLTLAMRSLANYDRCMTLDCLFSALST